jgi:hypothetical protein
MKYESTRKRISSQDLAQDRAFWHDLLARRADAVGLPTHGAGDYRNRRFTIIAMPRCFASLAADSEAEEIPTGE